MNWKHRMKRLYIAIELAYNKVQSLYRKCLQYIERRKLGVNVGESTVPLAEKWSSPATSHALYIVKL